MTLQCETSVNMVKRIKKVNMVMGKHGRGMPTLLMKTGRAFLAPARKPRPVFLPLKIVLPLRASQFLPSVGGQA
jgi:hypothetical protein